MCTTLAVSIQRKALYSTSDFIHYLNLLTAPEWSGSVGTVGGLQCFFTCQMDKLLYHITVLYTVVKAVI